jgi:hypothetical protein
MTSRKEKNILALWHHGKLSTTVVTGYRFLMLSNRRRSAQQKIVKFFNFYNLGEITATFPHTKKLKTGSEESLARD